MVMPDDFYSTTNNHTDIFHKGKWIRGRKHDDGQVYYVKENRAFCTPILRCKKRRQDNCR